MNVPSLRRSVRQVERLEDRTVPATFQVTNTANAGSGSLRQAIIDANALVGADTITFAIGTGAQRIQPTTALPTITDAVTIDGRTQPGFAGTPLIEIDFNNLAGLVLGSSSTTSSQSAIRSLSLVNSGANTPAIAVQTNQNLIAGCFIGLRPNGTTVVANREGGIIVTGNNNTIGGANAVDVNVISGNQDTTPTATGGNGGIEIVGDGTAVSATGTGNTIINNTVGANPAGATAIGNQYIGIELRNGARTNTVAQNRVYASTIVSALGGIGIGIRGGANNNSIVANAVGSVFNSLGNPGSGIYLSLAATTNIVSNNIVAGNGDGLRFEDSGTSGNTATGNQIFGSVANGVLLRGAASNNAITGRNIISGNSGFGALITGAGTSGNVLRTNDFVANALGGVHITTSAANNQIGGTAAGQGNAFSNNGNVQVLRDTTAGTGNAVLGNSFSGVAPVINNTPANFVVVPNIATVTTLGGGTTIQGSITGGVAGTTYRFEIYDSSTQAGAGVSNGGGFLGSVQATTDATGFASFSFSTAFISHLSFYSATATDLTLNNTSEFSLVTAGASSRLERDLAACRSLACSTPTVRYGCSFWPTMRHSMAAFTSPRPTSMATESRTSSPAQASAADPTSRSTVAWTVACSSTSWPTKSSSPAVSGWPATIPV